MIFAKSNSDDDDDDDDDDHDFRSISRQFSITFRRFSVSFCVRRAFSKYFEQDLRKSALQGPTSNMKIEVFGDFWDLAGTQKSTKNQPGAEKVPPETAPEAIFCVFSRRCCSESVSGPIFGRSDA